MGIERPTTIQTPGRVPSSTNQTTQSQNSQEKKATLSNPRGVPGSPENLDCGCGRSKPQLRRVGGPREAFSSVE